MKYFPCTMIALLASVFSLELSAAKASKSERPNIIVLMTDDQRWDCFGCYGRPEFRTEHIDRLAEEGVVFDKAYNAVAICMPSRVSMMTGRYFSDHRVGFTYPYNLTLSKDDFEESSAVQLKNAGYRTGFVGKFGFPVAEDAHHGTTGINGYDMKSNLGAYFDFFAGSGVHFQGGFATWPKDEKISKIYAADRPRNERTLKNGDAMIRFLETQPDGQPFCLSVSFLAVKNDSDNDIYPAHWQEFDGTTFSVPENWVAVKNTKLPAVLDHWRGVKLNRTWMANSEKYQAFVKRFAAQGYSVDQQVGRLVKKLEEMNALDNTVIIYTSDNGRFHGSQGLCGKAILYDESVKAPLIVFDGRVAKEKRGRRESALVSSVDIAPTLLALAGLDKPKTMQGRDLTAVLEGRQNLELWRECVYVESLFLGMLHTKRAEPNLAEINQELIATNQSYRCRGVRSARYKYFIYYEHTPVIEELYDMENDPHEMKNLANSPEHSEILAKLRKQTAELYEEVISQRRD